MLTWAVVFLATRVERVNGLHLVIANGCDVAIFYHIAAAIRGW